MATRQLNNKTAQQATSGPMVRWLLAGVGLLGAVVLNHLYAAVPAPLRLAAWLCWLPCLVAVVYTTPTVLRARRYAGDVRAEMLSVTWPKRDELVQMTWMIGLIILVVAVVLWLMDALLTTLLNVGH